MAFTLSLNVNPFVNRFADPDDLIDTVARDLRVRDLQFTHEFVDPSWPAHVIRRRTRSFAAACARTGVRITSGMTGPYGRRNHFGHPDAEVRSYYLGWFKTFAEVIADLGGAAIGSQFAILSYRDHDDPVRREDRTRVAIDAWAELAEHAKAVGLRYLFWEPMSVGREFGETIPGSLALQARLSAVGMAVPMRMMADIDHGDVTSGDPADYDPYAWARATASASPIIHVKQALTEKGSHLPFTEANNVRGRIRPEPLLRAVCEGGGSDNEICLELKFPEREPGDRDVIPHVAESVAFWAPHVDTGAHDLLA